MRVREILASQDILYPAWRATRSLALGAIPVVAGSETTRTWLDPKLMDLYGVLPWEVHFDCGNIGLIA